MKKGAEHPKQLHTLVCKKTNQTRRVTFDISSNFQLKKKDSAELQNQRKSEKNMCKLLGKKKLSSSNYK